MPMKSKFQTLYTLFGWLFLAFLFMNYDSNPPNNVSGAPPATEDTCANCHGGGSFDGSVSINGLPADIEPNTDYTITVVVSNPDGEAAKAGFQLVALDDANDMNVGEMSNPSTGMGIQMANDRTFAEHRSGQFFNADNEATWNFTWTSPASIAGTSISMYAAGNITNNSGDNTGDKVVTTAVSSNFMSIDSLVVSITNLVGVSCNGGSDGSATVIASGGTAPYVYAWSDGLGSSPTITSLSAGNYSVTVTDANNDSLATSIIIDEPSAIVINILGLNHLDCNNIFGSIFVGASGGTPGYTYSWSNGIIGNFNNGLEVGTYTVTATDGDNCTASLTIDILDNTSFPTANPGDSMLINCFNPQVVLNGTGSSSGVNFSYFWESTSGGNIVSGETTVGPTVDATGIYILTVTNNSTGCSSQGQVMVFGNFDTPMALVQAPEPIQCDGILSLDGSASSGNNPISYSWITTNGSIVSNVDEASVSVNAAGIYQLIVIDDVSGCRDTATVEVVNATMPIAMATAEGIVNCITPILTLDGSGSSEGSNISYLWTSENGNIVAGENTLFPEINAQGTYILTVTDMNTNCTSSASVSIDSNFDAPEADAGPNLNLDCSSTFIELDGTNSPSGSNISYHWVTNDGNILAGSNILTPSVNEPGTYVLMVFNDETGCAGTDEMVVGIDMTPPMVDAGPDKILGCEGEEVNLDGTASSIGSEFIYGWSTNDGNILNGETTLTPLINEVGTYVLSIFSTINGCASSDEVTVIRSDGFDVILDNQTNVDCHATATGSASVATDGGIAPYTYLWSNGGMKATISGLSASTYTVTVTDQVGCVNELTVEISEPDTLLANASSLDESSAGEADGRVMVTPTGGTTPYTILWSNGASSAFVNNLSSGTYTVTVTDANNCESIETVVVNPAGCTLDIVSIQSIGVSCNGSSDGEATVLTNGGTPPFSYNWSSGGTQQTETGLSAGTYSLTVTDDNTCNITADVTITEPDNLIFTIDTFTPISCNGAMDGAASVVAIGGTPPYQYTWLTTGNNTPVEDALGPGIHTVRVMDAKGCSKMLEIDINEPSLLSLNTSSTNESAPNAMDGTASVEAEGGTAPYTYLWNDANNQTTATASNLSTGSYSVTVADANGCISEASVMVGLNTSELIVILVSSQDVACAGEATGSASVAAEGGVAPYAFLWSTDATTASIDGLSAGIYTVSVTDAENNSTSIMVTIEEPEPLSATVEVTHESEANANDGTASITIVGGVPVYSIVWDEGFTTGNLDSLAPDEYGVTITDGNDCTYNFTFTINSFNCGSINAEISTTDASCPNGDDGSAMVIGNNGTEPYTYLWSTTETTDVITDLMAGNYAVTVTDANNCETVAVVDIQDNDLVPPTAIGQNITRFLDEDGMFVINVNMIDNGSMDNCTIANLELNRTQFDCSHIGENEVQLKVTDNSGNVDSTTIIVTILDDTAPELMCPPSLVVDDICMAEVTYDLPLVSDNCTTVALDLIAGLESGATFPNGTTIITYQASDPSGNTAECSFEIVVAGDAPVVQVEVEEPSCEGFNDGSIFVNVMGGTPPYAFQFSVPNPGQVSAGEYGITVTDDAGCTTSMDVIVEEPPAIQITIDEVTDASNGQSNGAIAISVAGGVPEYTYEWTNNGMVVSTEEDPTALPSGDYIITVLDQNDCMVASDPITIDDITNISFIDAVKQIELFPNPAKEYLNLAIELHQTRAIQLEMFDFTGKSIWQMPSEKVLQKTYSLDIQNSASGMYWIKILIENEIVVKKVVVE